MKALVLWLSLALTCVAVAEDRPQWTFSTSKSDGVYKYYVGRALDETSEVEAWRLAKDQAQESLIRENFGVETSISTSSYESTHQVALDKRVSELFPKVRLVDFEQVDSFAEKVDGRHRVWIRFRYPIHQAELERERLKTALPEAALNFSEVGSSEMTYSTSLEVTSEPLGIPVFIDGERWGVTPVRVSGVLPTGIHQVRLEHPKFLDVQSEAILLKDSARRVHHQMRPAIGYLKVRVHPRDAEVILDGVTRVISSGPPAEVRAGRPTRVEARANGYETQIQIVEVSKTEMRTLDIELNPIKKPIPITETTAPKAEPTMFDRDAYKNAWLVGFSLGGSGASSPAPYGMSTFQVGLSLEKRFLSYFGLRVGLSYDGGMDDTKTSKAKSQVALKGSGAFVGLPIYLTSDTNGFYLMPEIGAIRHERMVEELNPSHLGEPKYLEMKAARRGWRVGYMNADSNFDIWIASHQYEWEKYGNVHAGSMGMTFTWSSARPSN